MSASKVTVVSSLLAVLSLAPVSYAQLCSPAPANANASATVPSETGNETTIVSHKTALSVGVYAPHTRDNPGNDTATSIWLGVDTEVDYSDKNLPFSACALIFDQVPSQISARGHGDNGTCNSAFSPDCTAALKTTASNLAYDITKNSTQAFSHNNTFSTLPSVCNYLADQMTVALPDSCKGQDQNGRLFLHAEAMPITGPPARNPCHENQTSMSSAAVLQTENIFPIYNTTTKPSSSFNNTTVPESDAAFATAVGSLYPIMRVYMPAVNGNYSKSFVKMDHASADLVCLQPTIATNTNGNGNGKTGPSSKVSQGSKRVAAGTGQAALVALGAVGLVMILAA